MAINHRIRPKFESRNDEIIAKLRESAGAAPPVDPMLKVKRLTAEVAIQMALLHGGDWRIEIDHDDGFVVVRRRSQPMPI